MMLFNFLDSLFLLCVFNNIFSGSGSSRTYHFNKYCYFDVFIRRFFARLIDSSIFLYFLKVNKLNWWTETSLIHHFRI